MASRRKKPDHRPHYATRDLTFADPFEGSLRRGLRLPRHKIISVLTYLPRPVALAARRKVYTYPRPLQLRRRSRVIRTPLRSRSNLVRTRVRIAIPSRLPLSLPSYVSLSRGRLNIHSRKQLERMMQRGELNRRRYQEGKHNRRRARHGQLDSPGATAFGAVGEAYRRGDTISRIADAALGARAVSKGGY